MPTAAKATSHELSRFLITAGLVQRGDLRKRTKTPARRYGPQLARRADRLPVNQWRRRSPTDPSLGQLRAAPMFVMPPSLGSSAVLFAAEEPLATRRLASLADLLDTAAARRMIERLRDLLAAEGLGVPHRGHCRRPTKL